MTFSQKQLTNFNQSVYKAALDCGYSSVLRWTTMTFFNGKIIETEKIWQISRFFIFFTNLKIFLLLVHNVSIYIGKFPLFSHFLGYQNNTWAYIKWIYMQLPQNCTLSYTINVPPHILYYRYTYWQYIFKQCIFQLKFSYQ